MTGKNNKGVTYYIFVYQSSLIPKTSWAAQVSNSLFGWSLLRLYQILLESVLDAPRKLPLKFHQNRVSTAEIFLIWTNVTWANVAWTTGTVTVRICSRYSREATI